jgi:hypothetical protein
VAVVRKTLNDYLTSVHAEERIFGLESIAKVWPDASACYAGTVISMLEDPMWCVRDAAAQALGSLGESEARALPLCVGALERLSEGHRDATVRLLAAFVLDVFRNCGATLADPDQSCDGAHVSGSNDHPAHNRVLVTVAVEEVGESLRYASDALRSDRAIVLAAVRQSGAALQFASSELRADDEVAYVAIAQDGRALQHTPNDFQDQYLAHELECNAAMMQGWRCSEDVVFAASRQKPACPLASLPAVTYIERRAHLVNLLRELAYSSESPDLWHRALVMLDAFHAIRGEEQSSGDELAIAALALVIRADHRRFKYTDLPILLAAYWGNPDVAVEVEKVACTVQTLHCAETCLFRVLGGRVILASVPCWVEAILDRLKLVADKELWADLQRLRADAKQTAELFTVRVPSSQELPPCVLARGACASILIQCGLLADETWSDGGLDRCDDGSCDNAWSTWPAGRPEHQDQEAFRESTLAPLDKVNQLDWQTLAWAAACGIEELHVDVRRTLQVVAPVMAPAG